MCSELECKKLVVLVAEQLNIGYILRDLEQQEKIGGLWYERLKDVDYLRAKAGAKHLAETWEKERFPRPKELEAAVKAQGTALHPDTKAYLAWHETREGLAAGAPCPICRRPPSWAPRLMADCDPRIHYAASVPLVGCHVFLHDAVLAAKRLHQPWPTHDEAYDQYATAGRSSLEPNYERSTGAGISGPVRRVREVADVRPQAD
jgi:hypothetical protein